MKKILAVILYLTSGAALAQESEDLILRANKLASDLKVWCDVETHGQIDPKLAASKIEAALKGDLQSIEFLSSYFERYGDESDGKGYVWSYVENYALLSEGKSVRVTENGKNLHFLMRKRVSNWHHNIADYTKRLDALDKHALKIIYHIQNSKRQGEMNPRAHPNAPDGG